MQSNNLGLNELVNVVELGSVLDPKFSALFNYLLDNVDQSNVANLED